MSNYINDNLQKDEEIIATAKFSYLSAMPWIIFALVFVAVGWIFYGLIKSVYGRTVLWYPFLMGVVGIIPFLITLLEIKATELAVTNRRIIGKRGIFSLKTTEILINKIDTVKIQASLLGQIFNYYTLEFAGSGKGTDQVVMVNNRLLTIKDNLFKGVKNANEIKNIVSVAIEKYADESRKSQASDIADALNR